MGEDRTTEGALDLWSAHSENPLSHKRARRRFTICPSWRTKNCKPCAALNCFARGCYRFRNATCTESETDPIEVPIDSCLLNGLVNLYDRQSA